MILDIQDDLQDSDIIIRLEKPLSNSVKYTFFKQDAHYYNPTRNNCAYHEVITNNQVRWFADIDHASPELFSQFMMCTYKVFMDAYNLQIDLKYLHNKASNGYHVYSNVCVSLTLAKFIADRINAMM